MFLRSLHAFVASVLALSVFAALPASAQLRPMSEAELSNISGQGLIDLTNSSVTTGSTTFDFTRIALGADVTLNANFRNLSLGQYGGGTDVDIPLLQFGRSDLDDTHRLVHITNPYIEFVYRENGAGAPREVVGMRFGAEGIQGDIGLRMNTVSGSLLIDGGAAGTLDSHIAPNNGVRWDGSCTGTCLNFSQIGAVQAGDANGPSRDFWMSVLKVPVQFQAPNASMPAPDLAQAGVWLNWRDRLTALTTNGVVPPNLAPGH